MLDTQIHSATTENESSYSVKSEKVCELAIQDVVTHQEHLLKVIFFHDEKGHKVLSIYVTVIAAVVTAAFGLKQSDLLTLNIELFLGGSVASLVIGCLYAYATAWTAPIYLPGRKPDFWQWALGNEQDVRETTLAYLTQAAAIIATNDRLSIRSSARLEKAYICGLTAPVAGAIAVWLAYWGLR